MGGIFGIIDCGRIARLGIFSLFPVMNVSMNLNEGAYQLIHGSRMHAGILRFRDPRHLLVLVIDHLIASIGVQFIVDDGTRLHRRRQAMR